MINSVKTEKEKEVWHLDKTVSVTHIFTTISAIVALVVIGSHFDTRISLLEKESSYKESLIIRQEVNIDTFKRDVREDLKDISSKLDRVLEKKGYN